MAPEREPYISEFVSRLLPDATVEEKRAAQENVDGFMAVLVRIYQRIEVEGGFGNVLDKSESGVRLEQSDEQPA